MTNILIVCANQAIAETMARLIHKMEDWNATMTFNIDTAIAQCDLQVFNVILIGAGIVESEEEMLRLHLKQRQTKTKVVKHYGGGSGLLYAEIYQALEK